MTAIKKHGSQYAAPVRLVFAEEKTFPWLPLLLDAYHITDRGVTEAVARETKQGRVLACAKGCSNCCRSHKTIPVYPLELVGMTWYATEKIGNKQREQLKQQLRAHQSGEACPFLVEGISDVPHGLPPVQCLRQGLCRG